jgi:hypothetical protein
MMMSLAYVDPGLGLLAWQAVVAAFLGLLFYLKKTRQWLGRLCQRLFRRRKVADRAPAAVPGAEEIVRR